MDAFPHERLSARITGANQQSPIRMDNLGKGISIGSGVLGELLTLHYKQAVSDEEIHPLITLYG